MPGNINAVRDKKREVLIFHPCHTGTMSLMIQLAWQFLVSWVTTASSLPPKINLLWTGTSTTLSWKALVSPQQNSAKLKTFWICCHTSWARQLQGLILGNPAAARFKSSLALQCFKARRSSLELLDFHSSKPHQALLRNIHQCTFRKLFSSNQ